MLEKINSPSDLKSLDIASLNALCGEIRDKIIATVSKNGGHLASNLGAVELSVALHTVFDCPRDSIIFDVGHQCYAHKLLTGRTEEFDTLRTYGGISGFTNREESKYDTVTAGHSGSSVSAALGVASAAELRGEDTHTVTIVGDGSFTNGMITEALNNCSGTPLRLTIILNDNGMSISRNVGGLSDYLSRIRTSEAYFHFKLGLKRVMLKLPRLGVHIVKLAANIKDGLKRLFYSDNLFESMGLDYIGPVDGNDLERLITVLREAKTREKCTVVHVRTKKGLGYTAAEDFPEKFHSTSPFDRETGDRGVGGKSFTSAVSEALCRAGERDESVVAVCAAMSEGTGLDCFGDLFPHRFFDVGIAEEHAIAFCGGLAIGGAKPVCALYSTFAQRVYDQLFHDVLLQGISMTLLLSHAGLVESDGVTHQGLFDVPLFSSLPGLRIFSPDSYAETERLIDDAISSPYVDVIRYPKGAEPVYDRSSYKRAGDIFISVPEDAEAVIVTYGRVSEVAHRAAAMSHRSVGVIRVSRLLPIPLNEILEAIGNIGHVYLLEEGMRRGGFAERLCAHLNEREVMAKTLIHAVDGEFVPHGDKASLMARFGFTVCEVCRRLDEFIGAE